MDNCFKCNTIDHKTIVRKCRNKWHISIIFSRIALANMLLKSAWNEIYRLFREGTLMIITIS